MRWMSETRGVVGGASGPCGPAARGARQNSGGALAGQWFRQRFAVVVLALISAIAAMPAAAQMAGNPASDDPVVRGAYLFAAAGCSGCHTDVKNDGPANAGGRALKTPFGTFYSPNITPDRETGIGDWSLEDFARALHEGRAPDGSTYFPVFPYTSFTMMTDADVADLWAFLGTLDPVMRENREHDAAFPFGWRALVPVWQWLNFEAGPMELLPGWSDEVARGAYLVRALVHCGECHTPRDALGAMEEALALSGTPDGPEGGKVPNITPDDGTGVGDWSDAEILRVLETGMLPDFDSVGGGMGEVVRNSTGKLTTEDRAAIVAYLRSLPPIDNPDAPATQPGF